MMDSEIKEPVQILLVEDDINLSYLLKENLTAKGFSVALAKDGHCRIGTVCKNRFRPLHTGYYVARTGRVQPRGNDTEETACIAYHFSYGPCAGERQAAWF